MSKTLAGVGAGVLYLISVQPVAGQSKGTSTLISRLVPAQCLSAGAPEPCDVSGITFSSGEVQIYRVKQPGPVSKTLVGRITLEAVSPAQTSLDARMSARITYGLDNDSDPCPLASTQVVLTPWATSHMSCSSKPGSIVVCRGDLNLTTLMPASCANVDTTVEDLTTEVYESGFVGVASHLIARDGHAVLGSAPDCDSGGFGCP